MKVLINAKTGVYHTTRACAAAKRIPDEDRREMDTSMTEYLTACNSRACKDGKGV